MNQGRNQYTYAIFLKEQIKAKPHKKTKISTFSFYCFRNEDILCTSVLKFRVEIHKAR